jgi:lipid-A-disaccharide synthase
MSSEAKSIALVAGEASGDQLGGALIEELKARHPGANFVGIGGRRMREAGMDVWWDARELAVFGLFEVLSHFPRLLKIRNQLKKRLLAQRPDVLIGIDAPDFNLGLEIAMREQGVPTVHYVSPTVWAWRQRRVHKIARAADLVLCLFPFEPDFYAGHGVKAVYVGHPMADQIMADTDPGAARERIGVDPQAQTVALLPGSRAGEVSRLAGPMIGAARLLSARHPGMQFVGAMADEQLQRMFRAEMERLDFGEITLVAGDARSVIAASDVAMCASGTATLETMLVNRPLVMAYRIAASTYHLAKHLRLIRPQLFALPNILAGEALVPELLQHEATGERLASEVDKWLDDEAGRQALQARFTSIHEQLRCGASRRAAEAVSAFLRERSARSGP